MSFWNREMPHIVPPAEENPLAKMAALEEKINDIENSAALGTDPLTPDQRVEIELARRQIAELKRRMDEVEMEQEQQEDKAA